MLQLEESDIKNDDGLNTNEVTNDDDEKSVSEFIEPIPIDNQLNESMTENLRKKYEARVKEIQKNLARDMDKLTKDMIQNMNVVENVSHEKYNELLQQNQDLIK